MCSFILLADDFLGLLWQVSIFLVSNIIFYLWIRHIFKSCNIYLKREGFRKSKFTLSKVNFYFNSDSDFAFDNVNFDLRKRSIFKYMLQLLNIDIIFT